MEIFLFAFPNPRYASRAKNIKNHAKVNEDPKDALMKKYQQEIQELKKLLEHDHESEGEDEGEDGSEEDEGDEDEDVVVGGGPGLVTIPIFILPVFLGKQNMIDLPPGESIFSGLFIYLGSIFLLSQRVSCHMTLSFQSNFVI